MARTAAASSEVIASHTEELMVQLTRDEVEARAARMAQVEGELERHTAREGEVKATLKADRSRLEAERGRLAGVVRNRSELRPVEVRALADFKAGVVREIRQDTLEEVRARALSDAERQGQLRLHEEGKRAGKHKLTVQERKDLREEGTLESEKPTAKTIAQNLYDEGIETTEPKGGGYPPELEEAAEAAGVPPADVFLELAELEMRGEEQPAESKS
jgi:hypothetical protein